MKVLVTGASGFIGRYVVQELIHKGHSIVATSRNSENAKKSPWFLKVKYIPHDLNAEADDYYTFFQKPDILIHLAWEGLPNYKALFHYEKNLFSNYNFLKNIIEHGLSNCNVIGTCLEYGMQSGALKEDMETRPVNPYGLAKDTLRKFLEQLKLKIDSNLKWIRLFYMYGKGQSSSSILPQLEKALKKGENVFNMSGGEQLRDYLPVEKVAEYIVIIAMQNNTQGIINCASGQPVSIKKLVEDYLQKSNRDINLNLGYYPYPDYEPMEFWGDTSKLNKALKNTE